jgi:DNA ligase 1
MLAADCKGLTHNLRYPVLASPKLDGIRAYVGTDGLYSRNHKLIPNMHVQETLETLSPCLDGELVVGPPNGPAVFLETSSGVMSIHGEPEFTFYVFDCWTDGLSIAEAGYVRRITDAKVLVRASRVKNAKTLEYVTCTSERALLDYETAMVQAGYEGVMVRDPNSPYKFGRSTLKEGGLVKIKRFEDAEALVVGFKELQRNDNPAILNAIGYVERSSHKANKRSAGTLGALTCQLPGTDLTFDVGAGFTGAQRDELWAERDTLIGRLCKYTYFPTGSKERPRFPVWKGFRHFDDM